MSDSNTSNDQFDLRLLARRLALEGMPTQEVMANEAGVSQSTVSRALQGRIKTHSPGAQKLWDYALKRAELLGSSRALRGKRKPSPAPTRSRAPQIRRRRSESLSEEPIVAREVLAERAMRGLREYLEDAFDPSLVIEQLAVLRRAQDPQR